MYSFSPYFYFLKVKVPTDLPASALNRISEILDTQLGYVRQLGQYIASTLQVGMAQLEKGFIALLRVGEPL